MATYSKKASKAKPSIELNKPAKLVLITLSIIALALIVTTAGVIAQDEFELANSIGSSNVGGRCLVAVSEIIDYGTEGAEIGEAQYDINFIVQGRSGVFAIADKFQVQTRQFEFSSSPGDIDNLEWDPPVLEDDPLGINPQEFDFSVSSFLAGTAISLSDGATKSIEDIKAGDLVKSYDIGAKKLVTGKVVKTFKRQDTGYYIVNDNIKVTAEHPFYINEGWVKVKDVKVGDLMLAEDGTTMPVTSIEHIKDDVTVYNFHVNGQQNYFANGVLVHNKGFGSACETVNAITGDQRCDILFFEPDHKREMRIPGGKKVAIGTTVNVTNGGDDALVMDVIISAETTPARANCFANMIGPKRIVITP